MNPYLRKVTSLDNLDLGDKKFRRGKKRFFSGQLGEITFFIPIFLIFLFFSSTFLNHLHRKKDFLSCSVYRKSQCSFWAVGGSSFLSHALINASPLSSKKKKSRSFTLALAIDKHCLNRRSKNHFLLILKEISTEFEKEFQIQFKITNILSWESPRGKRTLSNHLNKTKLDNHLSIFKSQVPKNSNDIVIGITCQQGLKGEDGISLYQEGYVFTRYFHERSFLKKVLKHEICHLFGATHVNDNQSIMDRFLKGEKITQYNREIIFLHRQRNFSGVGFPLPVNQIEKAITLYKKIAQLNEKLAPNKLDTLEKRRLIKWINGHQLSKEQTQKFQKEFERLEDVYMSLSLLFIEQKRFSDAISECQKVLRINPQRYEAYNIMGIAMRKSGAIKDAIKNYKNALKINPGFQRIHYNMGIAYMRMGDLDQAKQHFEKALAANKYMSNAWNNLGYINYTTGNLQQAISNFKSAIECNPFHPLAHSNIAEVLLCENKNDQAMKYAQKALSLNQNLPGPHHILGNIYKKMEKWKKAENSYKKAISLDPKYYKAYYNLGNLYKKRKQFTRASDFYKRAVAGNPRFSTAYAALGDIYLLSNDLSNAEKLFKQAIQTGYTKADIYLNLSFIKIKQKKFPAALKFVKTALSIDPKLAIAHLNLGLIYFMTNQLKKAKTAFITSANLNPKLKDAWSGLGDVYFKEKHYDMARDSYLKSLGIDPSNSIVHHHLSVIYYNNKNFKAALFHLKKAEKLNFPVDKEFKKNLLKIIDEE